MGSSHAVYPVMDAGTTRNENMKQISKEHIRALTVEERIKLGDRLSQEKENIIKSIIIHRHDEIGLEPIR